MSDQPAWHENDELFLSECRVGHRFEQYVADQLRNFDLDVTVGEKSYRDSIDEASEYANEKDIIVDGWPCEVKSRDVHFTKPSNFPYNPIFVDTVSGWRQKDDKPAAVFCVSQPTGSIIGLSRSTKKEWGRKERHDPKRNITDTFFVAPQHLWQPIDYFVNRIRSYSGGT